VSVGRVCALGGGGGRPAGLLILGPIKICLKIERKDERWVLKALLLTKQTVSYENYINFIFSILKSPRSDQGPNPRVHFPIKCLCFVLPIITIYNLFITCANFVV
jgi:hypothetical protein